MTKLIFHISALKNRIGALTRLFSASPGKGARHVHKIIFNLLICACCHAITADAASYGVAISAVPVLNTAALGSVFGGADGKTLKTDRCGQVRELEFIALPETAFRIVSSRSVNGIRVDQVETDDYPTPLGRVLYVDSRLIKRTDSMPLPRVRSLPSREQVVSRLKAALGSPYVWGGNLQGGVPELLPLYYRTDSVAGDSGRLTLAGLDCSGLLYQATDGWTPRNTSLLINFGNGLAIAGRAAGEIARLLQPLDLIAWNGHVLIVLDGETVIESRLECGRRKGNGGVMLTPLRQRLTEILRSRRAVDRWPAGGAKDGVFVVRRWFYP